MITLLLILFGFNNLNEESHYNCFEEVETNVPIKADTTILNVQIENFIIIGWGTCFNVKHIETIQGETLNFKFSKEEFRVYVRQGDRYSFENNYFNPENSNKTIQLKLIKRGEKVEDNFGYDHRPDNKSGFVDREGNVWKLVN